MNRKFLLLTRRDYVAFRPSPAIYRFLFLVVSYIKYRRIQFPYTISLYLFVEIFYAFLTRGDSQMVTPKGRSQTK
jgi:hypothetical protein